MEAVSLVLLSAVVQVVARVRDKGDAGDSDRVDGWLSNLLGTKYLRYLYVGCFLLIVVALFFSVSGMSSSDPTSAWHPQSRDSSRPMTPVELQEREWERKHRVDVTWERERGEEVKTVARETVQLLLNGKIGEGISKFDELVQLVGDRQIGDVTLREAVSSAARAAEAARPSAKPFPIPRRVMASISPNEKMQAAQQLIDAALKEASTLSDPANKAEAYGRIAEAQADIGLIEAALATAKQMESLRAYAMTAQDAYCAIVRAQVKDGKFVEAKATATNCSEKAWAYQFIAEGQAGAGDFSGAKATAEQIEKNGAYVPDLGGNRRDFAYSAISQAQRKAGDVAGAVATEAEIDNKVAMDAVPEWARRVEIFRKNISAGDLAGAKAIAARVEDEEERRHVYRQIAETQADLGDMKGAKETASGLTGEDEALAYQYIVAVQAKAGDITGAETTTALIGRLLQCDIKQKVQSHIVIAIAQATRGDVIGADKHLIVAKVTALQMTDDREREIAFCDIARAQAGAGDVAAAETTASQSGSAIGKDAFGAYEAVLAARADAGDVAGVIDFITSSTDDRPHRCKWLSQAATNCVRMPCW
jgi:hypothetical protein